jgi:uncharacterized protein DUF6916
MQLTKSTFDPCLKSCFQVGLADGRRVKLCLTEVVDLGAKGQSPGSRRVPFALYFRGPGDTCLPQRIYAFDHERLGTLEIFIVPIGRDADGYQYEAIFN